MFEPARATSFLKVEPRMANFFSHVTTKKSQGFWCGTWNMSHIVHRIYELLLLISFDYVDETKHSAQKGSK